MKKILQFATYPIASPQHGGQKRVEAIYKKYNSSKKLESYFTAVYFPLHYSESSNEDIAIPKKYFPEMAASPLTGDILISEIVSRDSKLQQRIKSRIADVNPDIIQFEHPFLYLCIKPILEKIHYSGKIVYSSHNVESVMKKEMLETESYDDDFINTVSSKIESIELELAKDADIIFAVSAQDVEYYRKKLKKDTPVVLSRNGISHGSFDANDLDYWNDHFASRGVSKVALFVGSAHPPNWTGFNELIGSKVGFLGQDERIVMAGSIGEYFESYFDTNTSEYVVFHKRVDITGRLSESRLNALIKRADAIILPIVEGGGSNLKTAEALLSRKNVIATEHAMRAFEKFKSFPTIFIDNDPKKFRQLVKRALNEDNNLDEKQIEQLEQVTWDNCLSDQLEQMEKLV